jgi:hypothetical protein
MIPARVAAAGSLRTAAWGNHYISKTKDKI